MAYTHEDTIAAEENELVRFERGFIGNPVYIVDFDTDIKDDDDITKIIFSQTEEVLDKKMLEFPEEFYKQYNFVKTMSHILEIMNKECNKGYGGVAKVIEKFILH